MEFEKKNMDIVLAQSIATLIYFVRGQKIILDFDLAGLYQVKTGALNQAVKRNLKRFPKDFMFQLEQNDWEILKSQNVISKLEPLKRAGGRRTMPHAFTEQGVAMLSSVLNSDRAIDVNIAIMRTFVRLRNILSTNKKLAEKILSMEKKYDEQFKVVFEAIRQLLAEPSKKTRKIGF
jgi:hypothetical protein